MIKSKNFNNLSESLVPKLGRDEIAHFQCNKITHDEKGNPIYPTYIIPGQDKIWDEEKGDYVDIAYITKPVGTNSKEDIQSIVFDRAEKATLTLRGDNSQHVLMYQFLKLCNYNESNPNRDVSKESVFKEITPSAVSEQNLVKAKQDKVQFDLAIDGDINYLKTLLQQRGIDAKSWSEDKIRARVLEEAKSKPFKVEPEIKKVDSTDYEALLKEAEDADLIHYDSTKGVYYFRDGNVEIGKVWRSVSDKIAKLAEIVQEDPKLKEKVKNLFN